MSVSPSSRKEEERPPHRRVVEVSAPASSPQCWEKGAQAPQSRGAGGEGGCLGLRGRRGLQGLGFL